MGKRIEVEEKIGVGTDPFRFFFKNEIILSPKYR